MSLRDTGNAETVSSASSNSNKLSNANSSSATLSELKESACPDPQDDQKPLSSPLSSSLNQLFSNTEHPATDPSCMQDLTSGLNGAMSCGSLVIKPSKSDEGWKVFADVNDESTHSASDLPLLSISNEDNISAEQSRDSQNGIVEKFDDYYLSMFNS